MNRQKSPYHPKQILRHAELLVGAHGENLRSLEVVLTERAIEQHIATRTGLEPKESAYSRQSERGNYASWLGRIATAIYDQYVPAMYQHEAYGPRAAIGAARLIGNYVVSTTSQTRATALHNSFCLRPTRKRLVEGSGARVPFLPRFGIVSPFDILVQGETGSQAPIDKRNFYGEKVVGSAFNKRFNDAMSQPISFSNSPDSLREGVELLTGMCTLDALDAEQRALDLATTQLIVRFTK